MVGTEEIKIEGLPSLRPYKPEPIPELFHHDNSFVRFIRGPLGSSKTTACFMEIFARADQQVVWEGVRRSRWGVFRNSYPQLKTTTIKSFQEWFPSEIATLKFDHPISTVVRYTKQDGTEVENEIIFLSVDRPKDIEKITSLQLTGAYIHELRDFPKAGLDMITGRVRRFPPKDMGGFNWSGVIGDYNSPDDDHWLYDLAEVIQPPNHSFYKQPPAMFKEGDIYLPNTGQKPGVPAAENINNLPTGWEYYIDLIQGKKESWIKVHVLNDYGPTEEGKPVYPEYNDLIHCPGKALEVYRGLPLILGFDCGLTPAVVLSQLTPAGQWRALDELCASYMGMKQFCRDVVTPHLAIHYHGMTHHDMIDPAGSQGNQANQTSCIDEMKIQGYNPTACWTQDPKTRRDSVANYMIGMLPDGSPTFLIDPKAKMTRKGLQGNYCYARVQVLGEEIFKDKPKKNEYSHPVEGLQYATTGIRGRSIRAKAKAREVVKQSGVVFG